MLYKPQALNSPATLTLLWDYTLPEIIPRIWKTSYELLIWLTDWVFGHWFRVIHTGHKMVGIEEYGLLV